MIFVTGGTGFLGSAIVSGLLKSYPNEKIALLVRAKSEPEAQAKVSNCFYFLRNSFTENTLTKRLIPIKGNLLEGKLGISKINHEILTEEVNSIYHSAANTNLNLPMKQAKLDNLEGTRKVLDLALDISHKNPGLRFNHISTAYVAGNTNRIVKPNELNLNGNFRNSYEETKAHAEALIKSYSENFRTVIFRPSIIVGDSSTGFTSAFNVLYIPARYIINGLLKVIPALPNIPFDVVPVDYVAESIVNSHNLDLPNRSSFHLTAGYGRESSPGEVLDLLFKAALNYSSKKLPQKPVFLPPETILKAFNSVANNIYHTAIYKQLEKVASEHIPIVKQIVPFIPYMISNPRFDIENSHNPASKFIKPAPLFHNYAENIFRFCIESRWGKNVALQSF